MLRAIPTAAEGPEVDVRAEELVARDSALPRKVRRPRNSKFKIEKDNIHKLRRYDWFIYILYGLI